MCLEWLQENRHLKINAHRKLSRKIMTQPAISTANLRKEYGQTVAVQDLTLTVPAGEVFGFLGPNGAGKSTTIKMLMGLVTPTAGQVSVLGQSPGRPAARAKTGFLPEHFRFHEWLKAKEFLTVHGKLYGLAAETLKTQVPRLLEMVSLQDSADTRLSNFSKGMLQRIGLAQAMLNNPALVFLDEPTSGLDPLGRRLVRDVIHRLKEEGTTIFLNSHLLSEVEKTCDRVAFIKKGRVIRTDRMSDLLNRATEVHLRVDAAPPALAEGLQKLGRQVQVNGNRVSLLVDSPEIVPEIARLTMQLGLKLYELQPGQTSLEEIFVRIIETEAEGDLV